MKSGIYFIEINGIFYVGSAKNFDKRFDRHLRDLKSNRHHNIILQRAFNKYGSESIKFNIIKEVKYNKDLIIEKEQEFIDKFRSEYGNRCCNFSDASFGDVLSNHPNKDEIIERRSRTVSENNSKMSLEERKEKFGRPGELNGMFGNTHSDKVKEKLRNREYSDELREKLSAAALNKFKENPELRENFSKIAKERVGEKNPFYGKTHSEETRKIISKKMKGKRPPNRISLYIDNIFYESFADASRELDIPVVTIRYRCMSENSKFDNYRIVT